MKFYVCKNCGNEVEMIKDQSSGIICCGEAMTELKAGTSDGAVEKHVPVIEKDGNKVVVKVGSAAHPMTEPHYIEWIVIETKQSVYRKMLTPDMAPECTFVLGEDEELISAYAYCNLHGLWKSEA